MRRLLLLAFVAACSDDAPLSLDVRAALGPDPFAGATQIRVRATDQPTPSKTVPLGADRAAPSIEIPEGRKTAIAVELLDDAGTVVARGETPTFVSRPSARTRRTVLLGRVASFGVPPDPLGAPTALVPARTFPCVAKVDDAFGVLIAGGRGADGAPSGALQLYETGVHTLVDAVEPLPDPRSELACGVVIDPKSTAPILILAGGRDASGQPSSRIDVFAPATSEPPYFATLLAAGDPARARAGAASAVVGSTLFAVGGLGPGEVPTQGALAVTLGDDTLVLRTWPGALPRAGATATVGADGKTVLVAGGGPAGQPLLERILGESGDVPPGTSMQARRDHAAVLLADGRLVLLGGTDGAGAPLASATIYDPATGATTERPDLLAGARTMHAAVRIRSDVIVVGGTGPGGAAVETAEVYDATTLARVATIPAPATGAGARLVDLGTGQALLVGGAAVAVYTARAP